MTTHISSLLRTCACLTIAVGAHGQSLPAHIVAAPMSTAHFVDGTERYRFVMRPAPDSAEREIGVWTVVRTRTQHEKAPALLTVVTFRGPRGTVTDSMLTLRDALVPVWEISHQPTKTMVLHFAGAHVTGTVSPVDSAPHVVDYTSAVPLFNSSDILDIATALPLAPSYQIALPQYTYELGGLVYDTLRVLRAESLATPSGPREAWVASIAGPSTIWTLWIDKRTRAPLKRELAYRRGGPTIHIESAG